GGHTGQPFDDTHGDLRGKGVVAVGQHGNAHAGVDQVRERRPESVDVTRVQMDVTALNGGDLQAERVRQPLPIGEHCGFEQRVADVGAEGRAGEHEVLPRGEVADGGDDAAVSDRLLGDVGPGPAAAGGGRVAGGYSAYRHREVVAEPGDAHAERAE